MAHSEKELDQVIVFDYVTGGAEWLTPSLAKRKCDAIPSCQIIDEEHHLRKDLEVVAGPKPRLIIAKEIPDAEA